MLEPYPRTQVCREGGGESSLLEAGRSQDGEVLRVLGQECGGFAEGLRVVYMQMATHAGCKDCNSVW